MGKDRLPTFDLERFVTAQSPVMAEVIRELIGGRKETHWMWFVFPQLRGLGSSSMARRYGIGSRDEAVAYLGHPLLGPPASLHHGPRAHPSRPDGACHLRLAGRHEVPLLHDLFHHAATGRERAFERALHVFFAGTTGRPHPRFA